MQRQSQALTIAQSFLVGLQTVAAASILGDVIGAKPAALFIVIVAGAQQGVNYYVSKSVGEAVSKVDSVVAHAHEAISQTQGDNNG